MLGAKGMGNHAVVLKGHKTENGILKLNIRDSSRDRNNPAQIWIEKDSPNTISPYNQMYLITMGNGHLVTKTVTFIANNI